jgi:hypothetical protein
MPPSSGSSLNIDTVEAAVSAEEVLVSQCQLDIIALTWCQKNKTDGVWEITSRLWSRPVSEETEASVPFAPGEPIVGLSLLEQFLGGSVHLDQLGKLFSPDPEGWRLLLTDPEKITDLRRDLSGSFPALIVAEQAETAKSRKWLGLPTSFSQDTRLICWVATSAES